MRNNMRIIGDGNQVTVTLVALCLISSLVLRS